MLKFRLLFLLYVEWSGEVKSVVYSPDEKSVTVVYRVTLYGTDAEVSYPHLYRSLFPFLLSLVASSFQYLTWIRFSVNPPGQPRWKVREAMEIRYRLLKLWPSDEPLHVLDLDFICITKTFFSCSCN